MSWHSNYYNIITIESIKNCFSELFFRKIYFNFTVSWLYWLKFNFNSNTDLIIMQTFEQIIQLYNSRNTTKQLNIIFQFRHLTNCRVFTTRLTSIALKYLISLLFSKRLFFTFLCLWSEFLSKSLKNSSFL